MPTITKNDAHGKFACPPDMVNDEMPLGDCDGTKDDVDVEGLPQRLRTDDLLLNSVSKAGKNDTSNCGKNYFRSIVLLVNNLYYVTYTRTTDYKKDRMDNSESKQKTLIGDTGLGVVKGTCPSVVVGDDIVSMNDLYANDNNDIPDSAAFFQNSTIRTIHSNYPEDAYSFIALNGPSSSCTWSKKKAILFFLGLLPVMFQILLLGIMFAKIVDPLGEPDNPEAGKSFYATFIPSNTSSAVRFTQVISMLAYMVFPRSSLKDIFIAFRLFPTFSMTTKSGIPTRSIRFSCILKFIQGTLASFVLLVLVMSANDVVEIILNFTAMDFISELDEHAFALAKAGMFGPLLEREANAIAKTKLPDYAKTKSKHFCCLYTIIFSAILLTVPMVIAMTFQIKISTWTTGMLRVQFAKDTQFRKYSGCFEIDGTVVNHKRHVYRHSNLTSGSIAD